MIAYKLSDGDIEITPDVKNSILEKINKYIVDNWDTVITVEKYPNYDTDPVTYDTVVFINL